MAQCRKNKTRNNLLVSDLEVNDTICIRNSTGNNLSASSLPLSARTLDKLVLTVI